MPRGRPKAELTLSESEQAQSSMPHPVPALDRRGWVAALIRKTLLNKPKDGSTRWCVRSGAAETKISKTSAHRYFQLFWVKLYLTDSSTNAVLVKKLRDVVGLGVMNSWRSP